jgi:hypothetical protein
MRRLARTSLCSAALVAACMALNTALAAAPSNTPQIRTTPRNQVPACVTPDRLMAFLKTRNSNLDRRFEGIARWYQYYGEAWRVRWDYAFYQMAIETNFLTYRAPNGRMGDVDPKQNNFAGIGTTGGGVPGDRYPDVRTGVLAQIQHLVAYSGERLADPVAPRTQLKQDDIVKQSRDLGRPVHFADLSRRWAVDKNYGRSIEWVADQFRSRFCKPSDRAPVTQTAGADELPWSSETPAKPKTAVKPAAKPAQVAARETPPKLAKRQERLEAEPQLVKKPTTAVRTVWNRDVPNAERQAAVAPPASIESEAAAAAIANPIAPLKPTLDETSASAAPGTCAISTASYGGSKTVLIKLASAEQTHITALTVLEGFEKSMTDSYIKARAPGGEAIGEFADQDTALAKARELCPTNGQ